MEEIEAMAGKHGAPSTGDGRSSGKKPQKSQITQKSSSGVTLWKLTAKLWGSGKGKSK